MKEEAYVFVGYGEKYVKEAERLANTIKIFDKKRDYVLISNDVNNTFFDEVIDIQHEFINETNNHNKFCVIARIMTPKYVNYKRFLMIDTDILCLNSPEYIWKTFNNRNCFNCIGGRDGNKWHWGKINEINNRLKMNLKPMHGGLIYFDKTSDEYNNYYNDLLFGLNNYDKLGFKRQFRNNAMTDEIIISYANCKNNIIPFDFANYPMVSFCLHHNANIKENIITWGTKDTTFKTSGPTILNHFTGLHENKNLMNSYNIWYNKINSYYLPMDNHVTVVTGLFNINREQLGDGRKWNDYLLWFTQTLRLNVPMVVFCEKDTYDKIKNVRKNYPLTHYIIKDRNNLFYMKYKNKVSEIVKNEEYRKKIKGINRLEVKHPVYNLIIMNKFKFLKEAAHKNYFNSKQFLWVDAGCSRFFEDYKLEQLQKWPNTNKLKENKLNIQIKSSLIKSNLNFDEMIYECDHYTTATIYGGTKDVIDHMEKRVFEIFEKMINNNCINNEQVVMGIIFKENPSLFNGFLNTTSKHLPYFKYLSC